jgi:uncharacterized protein YceK
MHQRQTERRALLVENGMNLVLIFILLLCSGCATIMRDTTQDVAINSSPDGALASVNSPGWASPWDGSSCITPCSLTLVRAHAYYVTFSEAGCVHQMQTLTPHRSRDGTIEAVAGTFVGLVDFLDGAVYDIRPNPISASLACPGAVLPPSSPLPR